MPEKNSGFPTFQSTPSVGRATRYTAEPPEAFLFQSTPSVGRATIDSSIDDLENVISIHALRGEGDGSYADAVVEKSKISIHALRGEGDYGVLYYFSCNGISIHALRGEGDCKNIQICNAMLVHSAYKTVYFCGSCAFYLT